MEADAPAGDYGAQGTLPMRLLAAEYGADLVYTEELIDKRCATQSFSQLSAAVAGAGWSRPHFAAPTRKLSRGASIFQSSRGSHAQPRARPNAQAATAVSVIVGTDPGQPSPLPRLMHCTRVDNPELGSVDFIDAKGVVRLFPPRHSVHTPRRHTQGGKKTINHPPWPPPYLQLLLRTLASERERTVLQIGTSAPDLALAAASVAASEVAAVDVNMGCPLEFSTAGGMGSALLKKPETVREILTTLRRRGGGPRWAVLGSGRGLCGLFADSAALRQSQRKRLSISPPPP